jgi:hypothetical protein
VVFTCAIGASAVSWPAPPLWLALAFMFGHLPFETVCHPGGSWRPSCE